MFLYIKATKQFIIEPLNEFSNTDNHTRDEGCSMAIASTYIVKNYNIQSSENFNVYMGLHTIQPNW